MYPFLKRLMSRKLRENSHISLNNDIALFLDSLSEHLQQLNVERSIVAGVNIINGSIKTQWEDKALSFIKYKLKNNPSCNLTEQQKIVLLEQCLNDSIENFSLHNGNERYLNSLIYKSFLAGALHYMGWSVQYNFTFHPSLVINNGILGGVVFFEFKEHLVNEWYVDRLLQFSEKFDGRKSIVLIVSKLNPVLSKSYGERVQFIHHNRLFELNDLIHHTT